LFDAVHCTAGHLAILIGAVTSKGVGLPVNGYSDRIG